jgi:hypothetical protein
MSDAFWTNLPATLTAIGVLLSILIGLWNRAGINAVHKLTNSMSHELNKVTGEAARAEGHAEGKIEGKAEEKSDQAARDTIAGISNRGV